MCFGWFAVAWAFGSYREEAGKRKREREKNTDKENRIDRKAVYDSSDYAVKRTWIHVHKDTHVVVHNDDTRRSENKEASK